MGRGGVVAFFFRGGGGVRVREGGGRGCNIL